MNISFVAAPSIRDGIVVVDAKRAPAPMLERVGFKDEPGEVAVFAAPPPPLERLIVAGLGGTVPDAVVLRRVGGAIARHLAECRGGAVSVDLGLEAAQAAELAYGLRLRSHRPLARHRTRPRDEDLGPGAHEVVIGATDPVAAQEIFARLDAVADGVMLARDLTAEPGNVLGPEQLAEEARRLAGLGVEVEVLDPAAEGCRLLAAVGQGSARPPSLVVLRWRGGGAEKPTVLVGKGITFDAGGISIKPAEHMEQMKGDMGGAAAVLGAMRAVAGRRARANVCGVLALAENMPSGRALRPGDVVRSFKGLTVEVVDTDAEGRLVLADALAWACARLDPAVLVDAATLTGAVIRVLGRHRAGLYTANDRLARRLIALGEAESEPLWRLPLTAACDDDLKSEIADLKNCAWGRVPDNDDAARFLQHFVARGVAWAHLDIAGTAEIDEDGDLAPKGPTGFAVRLFDSLAGG